MTDRIDICIELPRIDYEGLKNEDTQSSEEMRETVEKAFEYAQKADFWLNPGWCSTKDQLRSVHPLFADFPVIDKPVWNNTKQNTPGGGNAFWETGPARPDLILEDLRAIFDGDSVPGNYYCPVD